MNEQFIYMTLARNIFTGECLIKVGFTTNPEQRIKQLRSRNKYFTYSDMILFQHKTKLLRYQLDEKKLHKTNEYFRTRIDREVLPEGYTEHYESSITDQLYNQLLSMGYVWINEPVKEKMFAW